MVKNEIILLWSTNYCKTSKSFSCEEQTLARFIIVIIDQFAFYNSKIKLVLYNNCKCLEKLQSLCIFYSYLYSYLYIFIYINSQYVINNNR